MQLVLGGCDLILLSCGEGGGGRGAGVRAARPMRADSKVLLSSVEFEKRKQESGK